MEKVLTLKEQQLPEFSQLKRHKSTLSRSCRCGSGCHWQCRSQHYSALYCLMGEFVPLQWITIYFKYNNSDHEVWVTAAICQQRNVNETHVRQSWALHWCSKQNMVLIKRKSLGFLPLSFFFLRKRLSSPDYIEADGGKEGWERCLRSDWGREALWSKTGRSFHAEGVVWKKSPKARVGRERWSDAGKRSGGERAAMTGRWQRCMQGGDEGESGSHIHFFF